MVKVAAPCLSLGASGSIAGALVFSTWKGRPYVRELVKPSNPRSGGQVGIRAMFKFLSQYWTYTSGAHRATWNDRADDKVISPFNAYMGYSQERWRNFLGPSVRYPATLELAEPGAPTTTPTAGVRQISLSIAQGDPVGDFGMMIHRSGTTGFTPAFANCIAIVNVLGADPVLYVDTPLDVGTHYYRIRGCRDDGTLGAIEAEVDATVV